MLKALHTKPLADIEDLAQLQRWRDAADEVALGKPTQAQLAQALQEGFVQQSGKGWVFTDRYFDLVRRLEFLTEVEKHLCRLTDGKVEQRRERLTRIQLEAKNRRALAATGGNWYWEVVS